MKDIALFGSLILNICFSSHLLAQQSFPDSLVLEDFESYTEGAAPVRWKRPHKKSRSLLDLVDRYERDNDFVEVISLERGKALRVYARDDSEQIALVNDSAYGWDLGVYPYVQWAWKAIQLPEGAREDVSSLNDSGAALYVVFDKDWLGRPRTLKYVYSSKLSPGFTKKFGALRVVVVSSKEKNRPNQWITVKRNVQQDYEDLFDKKAPARPGFIMIWSDSDNTGGVADVLFDDIKILN